MIAEVFVIFKKKRWIRLSYRQQGLVYFLCVNYSILPKKLKNEIDELCNEVGGFYAQALRELLLHMEKGVCSVAMDYNMSDKRLNMLRKEFYERFYKKLSK